MNGYTSLRGEIELKVLEGNPGKRPLRNNLRIKLYERRQAPRWLPKYGKQFWRIYSPLLKSYGLLTELDSVAFEMLCVNYAVFRETAEIFQKEGLLTIDERKLTRKHPAITIYLNFSKLFLNLLRDFGMTPSSRNGLDITSLEDENDPMDDLLNNSFFQ